MTDKETVILLHGLARTRRAMASLEKVLLSEGYQVFNIDYPSRKYAIETLADQVISSVLTKCVTSKRIHFVTHSMGGILLRQYMLKQRIPNLANVVMLAPPNQGSELVDCLRKYRLFKTIFGIAGCQLGTDKNSLPKQLGRVDFPLGVIAGDKAFNIFMQHLLPSPNDGTVSVSSTRVEGMQDHLCLNVSHPFLMNDKKVQAQTLYFLKHGHFDKRDSF